MSNPLLAYLQLSATDAAIATALYTTAITTLDSTDNVREFFHNPNDGWHGSLRVFDRDNGRFATIDAADFDIIGEIEL